MTKTTPEQFESFKRSVQHWINFFGLKQWEVSFEHSDKHIENRATVLPEIGPRMVKFVLTKSKWPYEPSLKEIALLGFHETCELMLFELREFGDARYPKGDLDELVHRVIRTLENSVFEQFGGSDESQHN